MFSMVAISLSRTFDPWWVESRQVRPVGSEPSTGAHAHLCVYVLVEFLRLKAVLSRSFCWKRGDRQLQQLPVDNSYEENLRRGREEGGGFQFQSNGWVGIPRR